MYVKIEDQKSKQQMQQTLDNDRNSQMHAFNETGTGVPAFLAKLWRLVDDPETNNLICWSKDGRSFIIQNQAQFARELLPLNYKHNNMASFIRQLNMYGFHKITSIDNGGLKFDRDEMEFSHPYFKRNCPYLLEHIKRKISNTKNTDDKAAVKTEAVTKVLQDVRAMRGRQDSLDSRFSIMKQENEALWREIASLRQKHAKQQQIVNKLIQFLITIVQPTRNMSGVKRHMQLMINDTPEVNFRKASESESECGPVIHELGEELLEEAAEANDDELMDPISPYARSSVTHADAESPSPLHMERPQSSISVSSQHYEYSNQSAEDALGGGGGNFYGNSTTNNQRNNSPNVTVGNGGAVNLAGIPNQANGNNNNNGSSVVQSMTLDGVQIVYHVTEVPDAHPNEQDGANNKGLVYFNDDNVLTTPMVREQMARTQMLKQKNKQRRQQSDAAAAAAYNTATAASKTANITQSSVKIEPVKVERGEIDPMLFLNTYDDNSRRLTPDPRMISPNFSEDSTQSGNVNNAGIAGNGSVASSISPRPGSGGNANNMQIGSTNMYNAGDFITENIPNDLFDDSSILSSGAGDNSNFSGNLKLNEQQQYGLATARGGKFSTYNFGSKAASSGKNGNANNIASTSTQALNLAAATTMPSTSAAAAANILTTNNNGNNNNGNGNMAVTKYKSAVDGGGNDNGDAGGGGNPHTEVMRDEVHGHLENVQDELESLKELLRGDGYSLDANTLMSLFNDSEVLGNYGLSIYGDLPNNTNQQNAAKGSELISYQPSYDLSDILEKSEDANSQAPNSPLSNLNSSVLNTPYHE